MLIATLHEQEIREAIGVPGEGGLVIDGVAPLGAAEDRCLYFAGRELQEAERESLAAREGCIVIVREGSHLAAELGSCRVLETAAPRLAIAKVLALIRALDRQPPWVDARQIAPGAKISPLAVVDGHVDIGDAVEIEPFCTVGTDVSIGRGSVLRAGARVHSRTSIGEESVVGPNTVLGSNGLGFVRDETGDKRLIPHLAGVLIGSHVEIGPLTVVQAGVIVPTTIEDHAKIDGQVGIGHGVQVARSASVAAGVLVAGSAVVGEEAWIGINASIRDGRRVGARALVGMDASVQQDVEDDAIARAPRPDVKTRPADHDRGRIGFAKRG